MAKTLVFMQNVHLSKKFCGIVHEQQLKSPDIKRGATVEIQSDALADLLIERELATPLEVEGLAGK